MTWLLHKYVPCPILSHRSHNIPEQQLDLKTLLHFNSELRAQNRTAFPNLSGCSSPAASGPFSLRGCLSFCPLRVGLLWCHREMRPHVEPPPAHPGTSSAPRSTRSLFLPPTRSVSSILVVRIHPCFSRQGFHAVQVPCILGSLQCLRELQYLRTTRGIFWVETLALLETHNPW